CLEIHERERPETGPECFAKVDVEGSNPFSRSKKANQNGRLEKGLRRPFSLLRHAYHLAYHLLLPSLRGTPRERRPSRCCSSSRARSRSSSGAASAPSRAPRWRA